MLSLNHLTIVKVCKHNYNFHHTEGVRVSDNSSEFQASGEESPDYLLFSVDESENGLFFAIGEHIPEELGERIDLTELLTQSQVQKLESGLPNAIAQTFNISGQLFNGINSSKGLYKLAPESLEMIDKGFKAIQVGEK